MSLVLRYMRLSDVYDVTDIDKRAFGRDAWPSRSFVYEVDESTHSFMAVLEEMPPAPPDGEPLNPLRRLIRTWTNGGRILAYGGLWCIADEGHISTIATYPEERGKGYGELLLAAMVQKSINLGAAYIVLEVRVSNVTAQNLYRKYDFIIENTKTKYYKDKEDAYDMRLDLTDAAIRERLAARWAAIQARIPVEDTYTYMPHPRLGR